MGNDAGGGLIGKPGFVNHRGDDGEVRFGNQAVKTAQECISPLLSAQKCKRRRQSAYIILMQYHVIVSEMCELKRCHRRQY